MTRLAQRGCRNPEHLLLLNPWNNKCWDLVVELNHDGFSQDEFGPASKPVCLVAGVRVSQKPAEALCVSRIPCRSSTDKIR